MEKKHLNVVCAVVHDGDKILCTQRLRKGPIYIAEHWDVYVGSKLCSIEHEYPDFTIRLTAYDCMAHDNDFKLLAHIDSCWLKPEEFSKLKWTEADAALIKQLWK